MLRGTEIVYIKFVLKFFKINGLLWSVVAVPLELGVLAVLSVLMVQ